MFSTRHLLNKVSPYCLLVSNYINNMLSPEDFKRQSQVINSLRFPAVLLVVIGHCAITLNQRPVPFSLDADNLFLLLEHWWLSFGNPAVALFALVTGYFYFYKVTSYSLNDYLTAQRKRVKTLLLPYVLWNFIAAVLLWGKNAIGQSFGLGFAYNEIEASLVRDSSIFQLLLLPIDHPLWYIREIIILSLASPLVYWLVRHKYIGGVVLTALFAYPFLSKIPYYAVWGTHIPLFFILGSYLGYHKRSLLVGERVKYLSYALGLIYPAYRIWFVDVWFLSQYANILLLFWVVAAINIGIDLYNKKPELSRRLAGLTPAVFFMYAAHAILIINLIRGTVYSVLPWDDAWEKIIALIVTSILAPIATYVAYRVLSKYFPRISEFLSGGRG